MAHRREPKEQSEKAGSGYCAYRNAAPCRIIVEGRALADQPNFGAFSVVIVSALQTGGVGFTKGPIFGPLFLGDLSEVFSQLTLFPVDIGIYGYDQRNVVEQQLAIDESRWMFFERTSAGKHTTRGFLIQFDGLRRTMALVEHYEEMTRNRVDYVMRVRDDDFFVSPVDLVQTAMLCQEFDLLTSICGYRGLNDRTIFVRRDSKGFETITTGSLRTIYDNDVPQGQYWNCEWLLFSHAQKNHVRVGYLPPCHFSSFGLRNRNGTVCVDLGTFWQNVHLNPWECEVWGIAKEQGSVKTCQRSPMCEWLILHKQKILSLESSFVNLFDPKFEEMSGLRLATSCEQ